MPRHDGLTLPELLVTLTIIAILSAWALPSFLTMRQNAARTTAVNEFLHALYLARSEAIKRGQTVSICKTLDGMSCTERGDWQRGWLVFANLDADDPPTRDTDEELIHRYAGWADGRITSNRRAYSFRPYSQSVVNGTIVFCDRRGPEHARAIIVSQTGRPRIAARDASNRRLACDSDR